MAIIGTLPYQITDGQLADAIPVMANFDWIVAQVNSGAAIGFYSNSTPFLTYLGTNALMSNTTGISNTAVGFEALFLNTTGSYNTGMGVGTLGFNTTGSRNTAYGYIALVNNTTGNDNAAFGYAALSNSLTASQNTAVGSAALVADTSGATNTAVGFQALTGVTSGSDNTAVGANAGAAGITLTTGTKITLIGSQAQCNNNALTNSVGIGYGAIVTASNHIVLGDSNITTINCQTQTISALSDIRYKEDVRDADLGLGFIQSLRPVSFRFNNGDQTQRYGFVAQEMEEALGGPRGVLLSHDNNEEQTKRIGYGELFAPLVKAIQELSERIAALEK